MSEGECSVAAQNLHYHHHSHQGSFLLVLWHERKKKQKRKTNPTLLVETDKYNRKANGCPSFCLVCFAFLSPPSPFIILPLFFLSFLFFSSSSYLFSFLPSLRLFLRSFVPSFLGQPSHIPLLISLTHHHSPTHSRLTHSHTINHHSHPVYLSDRSPSVILTRTPSLLSIFLFLCFSFPPPPT